MTRYQSKTQALVFERRSVPHGKRPREAQEEQQAQDDDQRKAGQKEGKGQEQVTTTPAAGSLAAGERCGVDGVWGHLRRWPARTSISFAVRCSSSSCHRGASPPPPRARAGRGPAAPFGAAAP